VDYKPSYEEFVSFLCVLLIGWNILQLSDASKIKAILRTGLRKADSDRRDVVRIPYNQIVEAMGWSRSFPYLRDEKFGRKPGGSHPALLSASKRRKLS